MDALRRLAIVADRRSWAPVIGVASLLPSSGTDWRLLALAAVPIPWLAASLAGARTESGIIFGPVVALVAVMTVVTVLVTPDLSNSLGKIGGVALGVAAYSAIARHGRSSRGWWTALALYLSFVCGIAAAGMLVTDWVSKCPALAALTGPFDPRILGIPGIPGIEEGLYPNQLAGAQAWTLPPLLCISNAANQPSRTRRWLRLALATAFSLLSIALVARDVSLPGLSASLALARADLLALAVLLVPVNVAARAMRWRLFFPSDSRPSPGNTAAVLCAGQLVNIIAPVRLGDVLRAALMAPSQPGGAAYAVGTVAAEKLCELLAMLCSVALLLTLMTLPPWLTVPATGALGAALLGVMAVAAASRRGAIGSRVARLSGWMPAAARAWTWRQVSRLADSLAVLSRPRTLAGAALWTAAAWLAAVATNGLTMAALGIALPWWSAVLVMVVTQVGVAAIPSAPGQVGVFHALAVLSLSPFAVTGDTALGYAVALHLVAYVPFTLMGVLGVWRLGAGLDLNRLLALGATGAIGGNRDH